MYNRCIVCCIYIVRVSGVSFKCWCNGRCIICCIYLGWYLCDGTRFTMNNRGFGFVDMGMMGSSAGISIMFAKFGQVLTLLYH